MRTTNTFLFTTMFSLLFGSATAYAGCANGDKNCLLANGHNPCEASQCHAPFQPSDDDKLTLETGRGTLVLNTNAIRIVTTNPAITPALVNVTRGLTTGQ